MSAPKGRKTSKLKDELRQLETEAYCALISAFRAQGELTWKKASILEDLRQILKISDERHKLELERVREDENLFIIAQTNTKLQFMDENGAKKGPKRRKKQSWAEETNKNLPELKAVAIPNSNQPPNLHKVTSVKSKAEKRPLKRKRAEVKAEAEKEEEEEEETMQIEEEDDEEEEEEEGGQLHIEEDDELPDDDDDDAAAESRSPNSKDLPSDDDSRDTSIPSLASAADGLMDVEDLEKKG